MQQTFYRPTLVQKLDFKLQNLEELRILICENYEATEEEIEKDVEKIDTDLTLYEKKLSDIKKFTAKFSKDVSLFWLNLNQGQIIVLVTM